MTTVNQITSLAIMAAVRFIMYAGIAALIFQCLP
jgi:hypothetical protein